MTETLSDRIAAQVPASLSAYGRTVSAGKAGSPFGAAVLPVAALRERAAFDAALAAFGAACGAVPGLADRRALASYWTQYYLAALMTPALTALLRLGSALPLALDEVGLELDAAGRPAGFVLLGEAGAVPAEPSLARLIEEHLTPLFDLCHAHTGLARRVLWGNAGVIVDYVTRELCREPGCPCRECRASGATACAGLARAAVVREEIERLLGWHGPCATCLRSPLAPTFRAAVPSGPPCRRVCCLRCHLPGVPCCGALCPVNAPARSAAIPPC